MPFRNQPRDPGCLLGLQQSYGVSAIGQWCPGAELRQRNQGNRDGLANAAVPACTVTAALEECAETFAPPRPGQVSVRSGGSRLLVEAWRLGIAGLSGCERPPVGEESSASRPRGWRRSGWSPRLGPGDEGQRQGVILGQDVDALSDLRWVRFDPIDQDVGVEQMNQGDSRCRSG